MFVKSHAGALQPAVPAKGGHNDLSRWEAFGGQLKRPAPPAPMVFGGAPLSCFDSCTTTSDCLMWGCVKGHGHPARSTRSPSEVHYPKSAYEAPDTDAA